MNRLLCKLFVPLSPLILAVVLLFGATAAQAWEMDGVRRITLHAKDGSRVDIGTVTFNRDSGGTRFKVDMDHAQLKDFFLSMREFKCREGEGEILCYVPYPYAQPGRVAPDNFAWLEHSLLFFFKAPRDFGAKLWNGIYFKLAMTERGLEGTPQAVDLNLIGAPPANLDIPPYGPAERSEIPAGLRWFGRLTIE